MVESRELHLSERRLVTVGLCDSVRQMRQSVLGAMEGRPADLVIDLRAVTHLSDPGVALLVGIRARQRSHARSLTLVCGPGSGTEQALWRTGMIGSFVTTAKVPRPDVLVG